MRNGDVSYWYRAMGGFPPRRPSLPGRTEADVCIVGGGYTGLWTAYHLKRADPELRVVVLEAVFAGFGASGRNGGWLSGLLPGSRSRYAKSRGGEEGVRRLQRQMFETIDEVSSICEREGIDADLVKGGFLRVVTTPAQEARLRAELDDDRRWGLGPDDVTYLGEAELAERIHVAGALGGSFSPHCARVQPAKLVTGLAAAVERLGVEIFEATPVTAIGEHVAETAFGDVAARFVLRATEGYTARIPGARRVLLPMNSSIVVTEPLPEDVWGQIGWRSCETLGDGAHAYIYAQRTADGRIAIGGRGRPYRFGSRTDHRGATPPETVEALRGALHRLFPGTGEIPLDHAWCGVLGVPRDWCPTVTLDRRTGLGWAGGYSGDGVTTSCLAGHTLADLVLGEETPRTSLPWVDRRSPLWEPEPLRWAGVQTVYGLYRFADRAEERAPRPAGWFGAAADLIAGQR